MTGDPWPPLHWRPSDIGLQLLAIGVADVAAAILCAAFAVRWSGTVFIGAFLFANAALKALRPANTVMRDISWTSLLVTCLVVMVGVYLIDTPRLLGPWTLIVVFGLFLVYGLGRLILMARFGAGDTTGKVSGPD